MFALDVGVCFGTDEVHGALQFRRSRQDVQVFQVEEGSLHDALPYEVDEAGNDELGQVHHSLAELYGEFAHVGEGGVYDESRDEGVFGGGNDATGCSHGTAPEVDMRVAPPLCPREPGHHLHVLTLVPPQTHSLPFTHPRTREVERHEVEASL